MSQHIAAMIEHVAGKKGSHAGASFNVDDQVASVDCRICRGAREPTLPMACPGFPLQRFLQQHACKGMHSL